MNRTRCRITALVLCAGFLLGIRGDRLTLWLEDDPEPIATFPCIVSSLPPADQCLLRRGIRAEDRQELAMLLEDYL